MFEKIYKKIKNLIIIFLIFNSLCFYASSDEEIFKNFHFYCEMDEYKSEYFFHDFYSNRGSDGILDTMISTLRHEYCHRKYDQSFFNLKCKIDEKENLNFKNIVHASAAFMQEQSSFSGVSLSPYGNFFFEKGLSMDEYLSKNIFWKRSKCVLMPQIIEIVDFYKKNKNKYNINKIKNFSSDLKNITLILDSVDDFKNFKDRDWENIYSEKQKEIIFNFHKKRYDEYFSTIENFPYDYIVFKFKQLCNDEKKYQSINEKLDKFIIESQRKSKNIFILSCKNLNFLNINAVNNDLERIQNAGFVIDQPIAYGNFLDQNSDQFLRYDFFSFYNTGIDKNNENSIIVDENEENEKKKKMEDSMKEGHSIKKFFDSVTFLPNFIKQKILQMGVNYYL